MNKRMFMRLVLAFPLLAVAPIAFSQVQTESETAEPTIVVFYEEGCPDCVRMEGFLEGLLTENPSLTIARYEITTPGALDLLQRLGEAYGVSALNVPIVFVGEEAIVGVGAGQAEAIRLRTAIEDCLTLGCPSPLARVEKPRIPWRDLGVLTGFVALFLLFFFLQGG